MLKKIKSYLIILIMIASGSIHANDGEKYIYEIQEAAKHHNDLFIFPYLGVTTSSFTNPYLGLNVTAVNLKFLPFLYMNGNFEVYLNGTLGFNAQLGAAFGKLKNAEQRIVVKSYYGGYNTTINEYIPVYIPVQQSWSVFAVARREQMPAYLTSDGFVENYLGMNSSPSENGAMFYGLGVGFFYVGDYKINVSKGQQYNKLFDYRGSSNTTLSILYSPDDGLYQGLAAALDFTSHYKVFSMNFGLIYSFAPFAESSFSMLDKMIMKFSLGIHFGVETKPDPVFDVSCTATGKSVEQCMPK